MTRIAHPLLTLLLSSPLLAHASILCRWSKVLPDQEVHVSFLWSDPRPPAPSLRLYHSVWSAGERALVGCAWSDDAPVVQAYLSLCRERAQLFPDQPDLHFDLGSVLSPEGFCSSVGSSAVRRLVRSLSGQDGRSEVRGRERVKRGFIVPGTLWCGSGNRAPSFADLGVFADTDSCCREHDQCQHTILSFHSRFGVFNSNIFTMSHCNCDNKFRSCLMKANDSISDVVGYTFFNLLKMHCFEFSHRLQCTQRNWFGMCKEIKTALYAEVHPPTLYESTASMNGTGSVIINSTTDNPQLFSITAAASTIRAPPAGFPSASITLVPDGNSSTSTNTSEATTGSLPGSRPEVHGGKNQSQYDADVADKQLSCLVYKDLDKCRNKILPQQKRFGLYNSESRTLYHCNCTSRLFQTLAQQRQLTDVQTLLLGRVSASCFLPQDCGAGKTHCTSPAVLVRAPVPLLQPRALVEERRHLQVMQLKVRRPDARKAKRIDRVVRLHTLCLRKLLPQMTRARKQTAERRRKLV